MRSRPRLASLREWPPTCVAVAVMVASALGGASAPASASPAEAARAGQTSAPAGAASPPPAPAATPAPAPPASTSAAAPDERARDLFRSQRYAEALAIYQRLRAETHHPTYLRNIGRCHQMLRQPAPAIDAFEAYLREARELDAGERREVEGYVAEMRRLELSAPAPTSIGTPADLAAPAGASASAGASAPAAALTVAPAGSGTAGAESAGGSSIVRRWWFWAGVGAVLATTIIIVAASSGDDRLPCPSGAVCP